MRPVLLMIAAMIMACFPKSALAVDDDLNGGLPLYHNVIAYSWKTSPGTAGFVMDFNNNEEYKLEITGATGIFATTDIDMFLVDGMSSSTTQLYLGSEFTYHDNADGSSSTLRFNYSLLPNLGSGNVYVVNFEVYRMQFGKWRHKSTNSYVITTICPTNETLNSGTLAGVDHEVANTLSVYVSAFPNGGSTELDGGDAVIMYPGFFTNMSGGGEVLAIIDGCGGAYRMATTSGTTVSESSENLSALVKEIQVYPNPVTDKFKVSFPKDMEGKALTMEVMDINGRILYSQKELSKKDAEVDLSGFQTGMYFITISGEGVNYNHKLIKQ